MNIAEEKLIMLALGELSTDEAMALQKVIDNDPTLQLQYQEIEETFTTVAQAQPPYRPSVNLRANIMDSIQPKSHFWGLLQRFAEMFDLDKATSQQLLDKVNHLDDPAWKRFWVPDISVLTFSGGECLKNRQCELVNVKANHYFPAHQHTGEEKLLVITGAAQDDQGQILQSGDTQAYHAGTSHSFQIISDDNCVFAVISEKPVKWLWFKTAAELLRHDR